MFGNPQNFLGWLSTSCGGTTGYVPFQGANQAVNLNAQNLVNVGNFSIGSAATNISLVYIESNALNTITNQRILTINTEDTWMSFGSLVGANFAAAWYPRALTPTANNFGFHSEGFNMTFNIPTAGQDMFFQEAGTSNRFMIRGAKTSGTQNSFEFRPPNNSGATASTEAVTYRFYPFTKTHAAGNIVIQRDWIIEGCTHAFASGTNTITNLYNLYVDKSAVTGPSSATFNWVAGFNGNVQISGNLALGTAGNGIQIKEGGGGKMGVATLVAGSVAISISGLTTNSRAFVQLVTPGGTLGDAFKAVCTTNTLTITSVVAAGTTQTSDTSTLNYVIFDPAS